MLGDIPQMFHVLTPLHPCTVKWTFEFVYTQLLSGWELLPWKITHIQEKKSMARFSRQFRVRKKTTCLHYRCCCAGSWQERWMSSISMSQNRSRAEWLKSQLDSPAHYPLDCEVTQLLTNSFYGDLFRRWETLVPQWLACCRQNNVPIRSSTGGRRQST